jgi:hypothetical protein
MATVCMTQWLTQVLVLTIDAHLAAHLVRTWIFTRVKRLNGVM